jgi:pimeloyl-ACP methyl ester carboxylesterase
VTRDVLLVPGLWMPAAAMGALGARLRSAGFATRTFAWSGRKSFDAAVERLARFAAETYRGRAPHFLGHSLGGVLILQMLLRHSEVSAGSAVLLGAPVRGCLVGRKFGGLAAARWLMGQSVSCWPERDARWTRREPLGIIAGTSPLGLGRLLGALPGESDGVVTAAETMVEGMTDQARVAVGHTMLIFSASAAALAAGFFAHGRFA